MLLSGASTIEKQYYLGNSQQHNNQLKHGTIGSYQVDRSVEEGGMPGEDACHHWQAGPGIPLCPACNRLQQWDWSLVPQN